MCTSLGGCGGQSVAEEAPSAALAQSRGAQEAFRPLKQRFASSDRAGRARLEPNLTWFVATYPADGLTGLARVYLGLIAIDRGDVVAARQVAQGVAAGQGGTTRDLAEILDGAILLHQKATAQALERFMPLIGKLIDPYARMILDEYVVTAAIGARRWYEAVAYMDLWLRDTTEETADGVRSRVKQSLETIPVDALELMLQAMRTEASGAGYGIEIKKALVSRLASVALDQQDTGLARRLVESTATSQSLGDAAEGLEELASSGGSATVDGRTIGLLISTGQSRLGARAAEVLTGVVDALRLAGDAKDHVKLATRDERDAGRTELALLALAAQGASILVAGLDAAQAEVASKFAERTGIPVILLSPLADGREPRPPAFLLGQSNDKVTMALTLALAARGAHAIAPVGGSAPESPGKLSFVEGASCTAQPAQAGTAKFPFESWRASKVDALLVLGDASCASELVLDVAGERLANFRVAVGLDAAEIAADPARVPLLVATAGLFPLRRTDATSALIGFGKRHGKPPSFWAAIGHDAAVLARAAEQVLPPDRVEEAAEVEKRHHAVASALGGVEADLWSTAARGFASRTVIARDVTIVEVR